MPQPKRPNDEVEDWPSEDDSVLQPRKRRATVGDSPSATAAMRRASLSFNPPPSSTVGEGRREPPSLLRVPFQPNVVGSGVGAGPDFYEGGTGDALTQGAIYETATGWARA